MICRYDRFIGLTSVLPRDAMQRALENPHLKMRYRDEIWNVHKNLPAGVTAAILPLLDCRNSVRDLYEKAKNQHQFIADMSFRQFKKQVTEFYHQLATHASSRQVFLSSTPYSTPRPKMQREYKRVMFSETGW